METYPVIATVKRTVIDTVTLAVNAETEEEALASAHGVLEAYPDPHEVEGVGFCYVEDRTTTKTKVLSTEIMKKVDYYD